MNKKKPLEISLADVYDEIQKLKTSMDVMAQSNAGFVDVKTAAKILNVSVPYLYNLSSETDIPKHKPTGKKIFFDLDELVEWFKNRNKSESGTEYDEDNAELYDDLLNNHLT